MKNKNNIQFLPLVASVGIGAATYSLMTGRGGQLTDMVPLFSTSTQPVKGSK
ncbi:hypothetical protein [Bacillus thermotolerans]|uniref:Uncharacterized protein n=1 Tax=Bacillus thermotolerans TaxID=1221996 RepID=A0A0F5HY64_BACTR|nr:hypothetical protein [Bacillus thermotolerans]KKB33610.1 hypothetical protein QY96_00495 [Bacillus thermotolerans]KKB34424.1 hypothetical protein QY97_02497 [Bacillus thermotolerans]KKB38168.1 hypothetical protein QY95_02623 [Bacillus thermotolerans]